MDLEKIGAFLAELRKERGLTQEQLGEKIGVTNKTVSRWEKGNYLPPAQMLKMLSELYGISINELLSGERLAAESYKEKAEANIVAAIEGGFSRRDVLNAAGEWFRKNWWAVLGCLLPGGAVYAMMPFAVSGGWELALSAVSVGLTGLMMVLSHLVFHVSGRAFEATQDTGAYKTARRMRTAWLIMLAVMGFICMDLLLATLHALTPAGNADGYAVHSMFYDILITDGGIYPDNCYNALEWGLRQLFCVAVINIDLTVLWMKRK